MPNPSGRSNLGGSSRNRHTTCVSSRIGASMGMQLQSMKAAALKVVRRSVGKINGYVSVKRCWKYQHLLSKRAIMCSHCGKWQA
jgi:hypothetical protein